MHLASRGARWDLYCGQEAPLLVRVSVVGDRHADKRLRPECGGQFEDLLVQSLALAVYPGINGRSLPDAVGELAQDGICSAAVLVVVADIGAADEIDGPGGAGASGEGDA